MEISNLNHVHIVDGIYRQFSTLRKLQMEKLVAKHVTC